MKKIGLFGGSFDPIHIGHMSIANIAIQELELDELWLIPTLNNPWKDSSCTSTYHRLNMLNIAIKDSPLIKVNLIEIESDNLEKNYTIDTLTQLIDEYKDVSFYYIMGMDQANSFHKWKEAQKISEIVQLVTFNRGGYINEDENILKYHFLLLNNEPIHASSSEIREGHIEMLDKDVLKYITNNGLYLEGLIKPWMKEKRYKHTLSVAHLASEIADCNLLNKEHAYIAGMFHDIAKELDHAKTYEIMNQYFSENKDRPYPILHQWVSRYISEHTFLIDNPIILDAIEHHTTGDINISEIGKCVYVADKLDPLRDYDSSKKIEEAKVNIHEAFKTALIDFYDFSKKNNREIDQCFYDIYDKFVIKGEI